MHQSRTRALTGCRFEGSTYVEAAYTLNGSLNGIRTNSLGLSPGVRF